MNNTPELEHHFIETNGIRLHVVQAGPIKGKPLFLLHGFPEFWYGWRRQIATLARAGYRLWIPDQRGYNLSDKPAGIGAYHLTELSRDILSMIDSSGHEKISLVGHDWGGMVAWWIATHHPERLDRLIILNAPHYSVMRNNLEINCRQILRSWYIFWFQIPIIPELMAQKENWKSLVKALQSSSRTAIFQPEELKQYREAWSQPGAITAMLNWYRAFLHTPPKDPAPPSSVSVPTLLIWGAKDKALGREMAQPTIERCQNGELVFIEEATHWVQYEEPERVNELILRFLR